MPENARFCENVSGRFFGRKCIDDSGLRARRLRNEIGHRASTSGEGQRAVGDARAGDSQVAFFTRFLPRAIAAPALFLMQMPENPARRGW